MNRKQKIIVSITGITIVMLALLVAILVNDGEGTQTNPYVIK